MDAAEPGGLGGTYGGNPISVAAALAVLDVIEDEGLCARAMKIGETMVMRLKEMRQKNSLRPIGDVRGLGAMVAFELVKERGAHDPDPDAIKPVISAALDAGLILLSCGYYANTIRILAPLTIAEDHLTEGLDMLESALKA
jgi:4-aminobutyrate aminotransferase-like enzyme